MMYAPLDVLTEYSSIFEHIRNRQTQASRVFVLELIPLAVLPPIFLYIGTFINGWDIGAEVPVTLSTSMLVFVCLSYFLVLLCGLLGMVVMLRWMAPTYEAELSFQLHLSLVVIIATPMVVGSIAHLYPHIFFNMLVFIPALVWSMYLLYQGVPKVLNTSPQQGMLMASSLIAIVLVGVVTLLGITVVLWTQGLGPSLGL